MAQVEYDAIVVGMGISGSTAAATLAKAGKRVLALEGQDRIGGRVCTHTLGDGVVELGAEWIHGTVDSPTYELAVQNNVSLLSDNLDLKVYQSDGSIASGVVKELIDFGMSASEEPPAAAEPLGQFITRRLREHMKEKHPTLLNNEDFMSNLLSLLELLMNNYEASDSWNDVSTASNYDTLGGDQHMSWHSNGYKTLFDIILNKYKDGPGIPTLTVKLNTEVVQVKWPKNSNGPVEVTTKDGTVYKAHAVIVTVSLGVLKERHTSLFSPPLPREKSQAIEVMNMGVMDKVDLLFKEAWWSPQPHFLPFLWRNEDRSRVAKGDEWTTKIWGASAPIGHGKVLTLWTSGENAKLVETLPADEVKAKCTVLLRKFMGSQYKVTDPVDMVRSTWYTNPFTRGSYSYDGLSTPLHPDSRVHLATPLFDADNRARVLFAGEATHPNRFSTVHGALLTGRREAARLLETRSKL